MRDDAWFSGFADGEGSFQVRRCEGGARYLPRFSIGLRADDAAVLEVLAREFGGGLTFSAAKDSPLREAGNLGMRPQCRWEVVAKSDLVGLVEYFDRFPLRAKKARDFLVWREAVRVYCASSGRDPRLPVLHEALRAGREFAADLVVPDAPPDDWQLALDY